MLTLSKTKCIFFLKNDNIQIIFEYFITYIMTFTISIKHVVARSDAKLLQPVWQHSVSYRVDNGRESVSSSVCSIDIYMCIQGSREA